MDNYVQGITKCVTFTLSKEGSDTAALEIKT